jgi:hypothetical protein
MIRRMVSSGSATPADVRPAGTRPTCDLRPWRNRRPADHCVLSPLRRHEREGVIRMHQKSSRGLRGKTNVPTPFTLGPIAVRAAAVRALAVAAFAMGAVAGGAVALGFVSVGRLVVGRADVRRLRIGRLEVGELAVAKSLGVPVTSTSAASS